ncbi:MAG: ROK family protein [Kiritimatiellia bacterium]
MNVLGIDIGGTKTAVSVGDESGAILHFKRMPTLRDPGQYGEQLLALCRAVVADAGLTLRDLAAVGISAPGPLSVSRGLLLAPVNNPTFVDMPIVRMMREGLGLPVYFNNDGNAAALAEWYFGEFRGTPNLIYLTFSTGMGGGVIVNGRLLQGNADAAGEFGHMVLDVNGPPSEKGLRGTWESYVGGRAVQERTRARIRAEGIRTAIVEKAGGSIDAITMKAITDAYRAGDPFAKEVWDEVLERVAQGLGIIIMAFNPDVIVLGTMAIREGDIVMPEIAKRLPRYGWKSSIENCRIAPSTLGDRIGEMAGLAVAICGVRGV